MQRTLMALLRFEMLTRRAISLSLLLSILYSLKIALCHRDDGLAHVRNG
jgi:hypothetical protein